MAPQRRHSPPLPSPTSSSRRLALFLIIPVLTSVLLFALVARFSLFALLVPPAAMSWYQKSFSLPSRSRGSYLITDVILHELPAIRDYKVGLLHLFIQHTSCALTLNENWDSDVRSDMSDALDRIAPSEGPKGEELYRHNAEGPDDMPAHIKSALVGASVMIPIRDGKLATGTWQGIWYLEFRAHKHTRHIVATIQGSKE